MNSNRGLVFSDFIITFQLKPFQSCVPVHPLLQIALSLGLTILEGSFFLRGRWPCRIRALRVFPVWPQYFSLLIALGSRPHCFKQERACPASVESISLCPVPGWRERGEQRCSHLFQDPHKSFSTWGFCPLVKPGLKTWCDRESDLRGPPRSDWWRPHALWLRVMLGPRSASPTLSELFKL